MQNEVAGAPEYSLALRAGARIADEFTLRRVLSASSGHALTYLAENAARQRVVIKEFLPRSLVGRAADGETVRPHTAQDEQQFARTLRRFAREADLLAQLSHRHLARVQRVVEENGTAYAVLEHYVAQPLAEVIAERGPMPPRESTELMLRLLDALATLHGEGIVHRDLSPDCVLVDDTRGPVLLALSAKRHVVAHGQELNTGYAALEQYGAKDLGPWTDVYASGALLYYLLTGAAPPSPVERASGQMLDSLGGGLTDVSPAITRVLMRALALLPDQRPHGARELQRQLEAALASAGGSARAPAARQAQPLPGAPGAGFDDERGAALRLAEGGIVVPNDDRGGWRAWLSRLALKRAGRDAPDEDAMLLESALAARVSAPVPPPAQPAPHPAPAAVQPEPLAALAPEPPARIETAVVASTPPAAVPVPAAAESGAAPAALQDVRRSERETTYDERPSYLGRRTVVAGAIMVILMLTAGITYAARSSSGSRGKSVLVADGPGGRQRAAGLTPAPSSAMPDSHVVRNGNGPAVLQGSSSSHVAEAAGRLGAPAGHASPVHDASGIALSRGATSDTRESSRPADHRPAESRSAAADASSKQPLVPMPATSINVAVPVTDPQLRFLPPTLVPDLRLHLTTGKAYSDQGQYEAARRAFRSALDQLDSAVKRFSATDELRAMRRQLEAADAEAAQACTAENEMRRTRGGKLLQCQ